tara:strand:+ start:1520 stop:1660 length:141 start_codon:yes stop_codon:yes gene_type:complete
MDNSECTFLTLNDNGALVVDEKNVNSLIYDYTRDNRPWTLWDSDTW